MAHHTELPEEPGYLIPEDDFARLLRLRTVSELLSCLIDDQFDIITLDHVAAVAEYLTEDARILIERSRYILPMHLKAGND